MRKHRVSVFGQARVSARGGGGGITPAFLGVPNKGDKIKAGPKDGGNATSPLHSRGSPNKWGQNQNWLPKPCLLGGPQLGGNATSTLVSRGYPTKGTKSKHKKNKKNKNKKFPMASFTLPIVQQIAPSGGFEPTTI